MNYSTRDKDFPITDKCIILDMDETLVHIFDRTVDVSDINIEDPANYDIKNRLYFFESGHRDKRKMMGIKRLYLDDFIDFCNWFFKVVVIWSAGEETYVRKTCKWIFRGHAPPFLILARDKCKGDELTKPLKYLTENMNLKNIFNLSNTLIVDDRESTFVLENPANAIRIPPFSINSLTPYNIRSDTDYCLRQLTRWLQKKEVMDSVDVRNLKKDNIFT